MNMDPMSTNTEDFLFRKPENILELSSINNIAISMGALASRLVDERRTRVIHPDGRRENVAEHAHMLARVATYIAQQNYPWLDRGLIAIFSTIHDDPEAWVGDTPTDSIAAHDPNRKAIREQLAVERLTKEYSLVASGYVEDMHRYEAQGSDEERFTRIVDKFMPLLVYIPEEGETLRANYSYERVIKDTLSNEKRLLEQYPEWIVLIETRTELAKYIANKYIRDWKGPHQDILPFDM